MIHYYNKIFTYIGGQQMNRNWGKVLQLVVALMFTIICLTDGITTFASSKSWCDGLQVKNPYESVTQSDEYVDLDDGEETPSLSDDFSVSVVGNGSLPSTYMNSLAKLIEKYPTVRNQGTYNTCWAFSAAGMAELDLITDNKTANNTIDLSEEQIAYFTYHSHVDDLGGLAGDSLTTTTNYLKFGGSLSFAARTLMQWNGVVEESLMPYKSKSSLLESYSSYTVSQDVAHLQNAYIINIHEDQASVKQEIINHGSAGIGLYMGGMSEYGGSAVYNKTGETVATYYCPTDKDPDHALLIVGWDDNFPASSFVKKPAGNGAWLVRNSWSSSSKNSLYSYFWVSYYDKSIEDNAWVFDFESADNYDYNYQYDGCEVVYGMNGLLYSSSGKSLDLTKFSNVFKAQGSSNELLDAVSVTFNEDSELPYEIRIYTDLSDPSDPESGVLADTITGETTYAGAYTIPLNTSVSLSKGTYFSVVVETESGSNGIDAEYSYNFNKSSSPLNLVAKAAIKKNQSFIYYKNKWRDLSDLKSKVGNLCIKAYTKSVSTGIDQIVLLKKTSVKTSSVKLIWNKSAGAKGYEIYRSRKKNGAYAKVATVKKCSYTDKKLKKNTTYYYKIRAFKSSKGTKIYGKFSSSVKMTTKK
jgi:C1A family cysteine protease